MSKKTWIKPEIVDFAPIEKYRNFVTLIDKEIDNYEIRYKLLLDKKDKTIREQTEEAILFNIINRLRMCIIDSF